MIKPVKTIFNAFMMLFLLIGCQPTEEKSDVVLDETPQETPQVADVSVTFQVPTPKSRPQDWELIAARRYLATIRSTSHGSALAPQAEKHRVPAR